MDVLSPARPSPGFQSPDWALKRIIGLMQDGLDEQETQINGLTARIAALEEIEDRLIGRITDVQIEFSRELRDVQERMSRCAATVSQFESEIDRHDGRLRSLEVCRDIQTSEQFKLLEERQRTDQQTLTEHQKLMSHEIQVLRSQIARLSDKTAGTPPSHNATISQLEEAVLQNGQLTQLANAFAEVKRLCEQFEAHDGLPVVEAVARLVEDKKRLDWLESQARGETWKCVATEHGAVVYDGNLFGDPRRNVREAIDHAREPV